MPAEYRILHTPSLFCLDLVINEFREMAAWNSILKTPDCTCAQIPRIFKMIMKLAVWASKSSLDMYLTYNLFCEEVAYDNSSLHNFAK